MQELSYLYVGHLPAAGIVNHVGDHQIGLRDDDEVLPSRTAVEAPSRSESGASLGGVTPDRG
jgi:hypothetical protein